MSETAHCSFHKSAGDQVHASGENRLETDKPINILQHAIMYDSIDSKDGTTTNRRMSCTLKISFLADLGASACQGNKLLSILSDSATMEARPMPAKTASLCVEIRPRPCEVRNEPPPSATAGSEACRQLIASTVTPHAISITVPGEAVPLHCETNELASSFADQTRQMEIS